MAEIPFEDSLENVGPGLSSLSLSDFVDSSDFVSVFLQRDLYYTNYGDLVRTLVERIEDFRDYGAEPVANLSESAERGREWQDGYEPPYALLADPDATAGETLDQPVRFGILGDWIDFLGRMPQIAILDGGREPPDVGWTYVDRSTFDRPSVEDILEILDDYREGAV